MPTKKELLEELSLTKLKKLAKEYGVKDDMPPVVWSVKDWWVDKLCESHKVTISVITKDMEKKKRVNNKKEVKSPSLTASQKRELERKAGFKCELCGRSTEDFKPDVHHIKPKAKGGSNRDSNLIVLCPTCHRRVHDRRVSQADLKKAISKRK